MWSPRLLLLGVPAFVGFVAAGVPLGVTMSFLIASPLVNEVMVVLLHSPFGFSVAARYVGSGLLIAVIDGWPLGKLRPYRWVELFVLQVTLQGSRCRPVRR